MEIRAKFPIKSAGIFATGLIAGYIGPVIARKVIPLLTLENLKRSRVTGRVLPVIPEFDENISGLNLSSQLMNHE